MSEKRFTDAQIRERYAAQEAAIRAIEARVDQLDKWASEAASKGDFSGAGSNQKAAVDLHCAVAIIQDALFPHDHLHPGFRWDAGDTCLGCELDEYLRTGK